MEEDEELMNETPEPEPETVEETTPEPEPEIVEEPTPEPESEIVEENETSKLFVRHEEWDTLQWAADVKEAEARAELGEEMNTGGFSGSVNGVEAANLSGPADELESIKSQREIDERINEYIAKQNQWSRNSYDEEV